MNNSKITQTKIDQLKFTIGYNLLTKKGDYIDTAESISINRTVTQGDCAGLLSYAQSKGEHVYGRVNNAMSFVESVIVGGEKPLDGRIVADVASPLLKDVDNATNLACTEAFVIGLAEIFKNSDKDGQQALLPIKETFLNVYKRYHNHKQAQFAGHKKALESTGVPQPSYARYAFAILGFLLAVILAQKWLNA